MIKCFLCLGVLLHGIVLSPLSAEPKKSIPLSYEWKHRVYLASHPRSGNHWMRYLIEEATGLATSSVYRDRDYPQHLPTIFPWGGYSAKNGYEGNVLYPSADREDIVVVKTHYPYVNRMRFDLLPYTAVVVVVRHPLDVIYSHYFKGTIFDYA